MANRPLGKLDANWRAIPDSFSELAFRGEYSGTNLIYRGLARTGVSESALKWSIALLTYDGDNNLLSIKWPENSKGHATSDYIFSWTDRASYTYS